MLQIAIKTFPPPLISSTHQSNPNTHFQNPVISAKWGKKRSGSRTSRKLILDSIAFVASNLKILPEPFDSMAKDFWVASTGGGNGGKFRFTKGLGGGGEGRNRRGRKLGYWIPLMISSAFAMWVVLERERGGREKDLWFWGLLIVSVVAVGMRCWRREIKDWVLGFTCGAALMGLGFRNNEDFMKLIDNFRVNSMNFVTKEKKRRRCRRWI